MAVVAAVAEGNHGHLHFAVGRAPLTHYMADVLADSFGYHSAGCFRSSYAMHGSAIAQAEDPTVGETPSQLLEVAEALPLGVAVVDAPPLAGGGNPGRAVKRFVVTIHHFAISATASSLFDRPTSSNSNLATSLGFQFFLRFPARPDDEANEIVLRMLFDRNSYLV